MLFSFQAPLIVNYGLANGDTIFTSPNQGDSVNTSLGFKFPYQYYSFTTIGINVNGFITFNDSTPIYAFMNYFTTNGGGAVYYRNVNDSADQTLIQIKVAAAYPIYSTFNPNNSFVITW
jgi:hypothetical protein